LLDALKGRTVSRFVPGALPRAGVRVSRVTVPMAAVWADGRPVSFCYPVWQTETRWDVSIETLVPYRRLGLAARGARTLIRYMRGTGRAPVWGALETNTASRTLAARLGFLEAAGIAVFSAA
jgi:GNAT acetyltransferase-like protein